MTSRKNTLCFGDNLAFLKNPSLFPDESIDLIYLDPPFNSQRGYNVLFKEVDGTPSASQIQAFDDTWSWDEDAAARYEEIQETAPGQVVAVMSALQIMLGHSPMFAYLVQMCSRLVQLHRVLKKTGSLYLHCDPTASHYLKMVLDAVFDARKFQNEITWKRSSAHSDSKQGMTRCGRIHDVILFYSKGSTFTWNQIYVPYTQEYTASEYRHVHPDGRRYKETDLTAAKPGGDTNYIWRVKRPINEDARWIADLKDEHLKPRKDWEYREVRPYDGRFWAYSKANLLQFVAEGRIIHRETGMPRLMQFADEMPGIPLQDVWDDIPPIGALAAERLGYPTQKPIALLKRIILASSNPGDIILDPFCGCGTTIDAVETINRENPEQKKRVWIGIDITYLAVTLIKNRLARFERPRATFDVIGEPEDTKSAEFLAHRDRHEFQYWALGLIGARPWTDQKKKGADKGIDGVRFFNDEGPQGKPKPIFVQVKSGHVKSGDIRDFHGTLEREKAAMGVFITLEPPSADMKKEALEAGKYLSLWNQEQYPRIQILTVEQLLSDSARPNPTCLRLPPSYAGETFKQAAREKTAAQTQLEALL